MPFEHSLKNAYIWQVWTPWANTVVYYNIDDNDTTSAIYDKSWNNYTLSWGTFSFYTDANAWRCYTWGSYSTLPSRSIINFWNSFTFITWCKPTSAPWSTWMSAFANWATSSTHASNWISVFSNGSIIWWSAWVNNYNLKVISDASAIWTYWQWKMIAYTRDNSGNLILYLNWTSIKTNTVSWSVTYPSSSQFLLWGWRSGDKQSFQGYIKCLIWENTTWTAQKIANYYNLTKSNYWL